MMAPKATTWLHVSGYRFLLRRMECALLGRDLRAVDEPLRAPLHSLAAGAVLAAIAVVAAAVLAVLRPQAALGNASIVMGQQSGALYVRVSDTLHPVLNLASARLIAATNSNPQPVAEAELANTKRGPQMGIPGAPQALAAPLTAEETRWTVCDTGERSRQTTVVVGAVEGVGSRRMTANMLVTAGTSTYLLNDGHRAVVDLADPAVVRALRLEGVTAQHVSRALLNAIPEAPPITAPRISGAGGAGALAGFPIGSVLRLARADGDEYYVVLKRGVQRVGQVTADLLRFTGVPGTRTVLPVAPDRIRAVPTVNELPVSTFPDRVSTSPGNPTTLCVAWSPSDVWFVTGDLPIPTGHAPVTLSQSDGDGPALDAVYLPPGRSAFVRATGLSGDRGGAGTRYLVTDTGVRYAIADDEAATALGMPQTPIAAPWPMLATLPAGPELSRRNALVVRDAP